MAKPRPIRPQQTRTAERPRADRPAPHAWWRSRAAVLTLAVVGSLAGALAYAGPVAVLVVDKLLLELAWTAAWLASAAGLGSAAWRWWSPADARSESGSPDAAAAHRPGDAGPLLGWITATALGLGMMSLVVLGLGLAGWLSRGIAIALLLIGLGLGAWQLRASRRRPDGSDEPATGPSDDHGLRRPAGWGWVWLAVIPFASVALVAAMVPPGILWKPEEPHGYDVVAYHFQVPREWHEAGRIVPLRHNAFSYFPFNVEMHYLLAMHLRGGPYAGMYLAQFMHLAMVALGVAAACAVARRVVVGRGGGTVAVVGGVAAATVPWLTQLGPIGFNEGGFLFFSALSIGWALLGLKSDVDRGRRFALAGAMAGFACGCKLTAVPEVLVGVPVFAALAMLVRQRSMTNEAGAAATSTAGPSRLRAMALPLAAFVAAGVLTFAPWLVRNVAWVGNPVFPEGTSLFGRGHFSDVQVERWKRAHGPQPAQQAWFRWGTDPATGEPRAEGRVPEFWRQVLRNWQFGYLLVPLSVAAAVVAARAHRRAVIFLGGLLLLLTAFWLGLTHLQGRFYVLAIPVGVLLIAHLPPARPVPAVLLAGVLAAAVPGWLRLHGMMTDRLYGSPQTPAVVGALMRPDVDWLTGEILRPEDPAAPRIPDGASVLLVGDAKAFWYPLPAGRLRYHSAFDVDAPAGRSLADAWGVSAGPPGEWVVVDPPELARFHNTYQPFPDPPPEWTSRPEWRAGRPFLVPPASAPNAPAPR